MNSSTRKIKQFLLAVTLLSVNILSAQNFKIQASFRETAQIYYSDAMLTLGYHISQNDILGLGVGYSYTSGDARPEDMEEGIPVALYYRHYFHLGKTSRLSICTDLFLGGTCYTKIKGHKTDKNPPEKGDWIIYPSFQPSLDIGLGKKRRSHIFLGPTILPSLGLHLGYAVSF